VLKDAKSAFALTEAVAPVNIKVGECSGFRSTALRRSGKAAWEKLKAPFLLNFSWGSETLVWL
jgi:hypothetical protein